MPLDTTIIIDAGEAWACTCSLRAFLEANDDGLTAEDVTELLITLASGERYVEGAGACGGFTVEVAV